MKILVVEDERQLCDDIAEDLELERYTVERCYDGLEAWEQILVESYDLVILDLNLPGMDGLDILRSVRREKPELRVLILSARSSLANRVEGLDLGADDYLTKPFELEELEARVRSLLRRAQMPASGGKTRLVCEDLVLDPATHTVTVEGRPVELTHKEYSLLQCLMENSNRVMERSELLSTVWGYENLETRTLDIHIQSLRKKLGKAGEGHIKTVRGVGYRFVQESNT